MLLTVEKMCRSALLLDTTCGYVLLGTRLDRRSTGLRCGDDEKWKTAECLRYEPCSFIRRSGRGARPWDRDANIAQDRNQRCRDIGDQEGYENVAERLAYPMDECATALRAGQQAVV